MHNTSSSSISFICKYINMMGIIKHKKGGFYFHANRIKDTKNNSIHTLSK